MPAVYWSALARQMTLAKKKSTQGLMKEVSTV